MVEQKCKTKEEIKAEMLSDIEWNLNFHKNKIQEFEIKLNLIK